MWKEYFGAKAIIFGIDVDERCKDLEEENIKIFIGSQSDRKFLREVKTQIPPIDILIDDGGHTMNQQIVSFEELFETINENGIYLCEDLHTSYWDSFGGGYKRKGTYIEYSKNFIDYLNANHSKQKLLQVNGFTKSVDSIHYYDSIIVIEKKKRLQPPHAEVSGNAYFIRESDEKSIISLPYKLKLLFVNTINIFLRTIGIKNTLHIGKIFGKR